MSDHSRRWVPNIDPDPRSGGGYAPGWLPGADRMEIFDRRDLLDAYDRDDIRWLDRHWGMARIPPRPPSWWRRLTAIDSAFWPLMWLAMVLLVVPTMAILFLAVIGDGP